MRHLQPLSSLLQAQTHLAPVKLPAVFLAPSLHLQHASFSSHPVLRKDGSKSAPQKKRRAARTTYKQYDLKKAIRFALCDAMRYIQAFEVGQPASTKYELAVRLNTPKQGPVARNRVQLPHPVSTDARICVICPSDSREAKEALAAGAVVVGDDAVLEDIKKGQIEFDRCLCHIDSFPKLTKSGVARILGPKGLMPSAKTNTVIKSIGPAVKELVGGSQYRERVGVVRLPIGQIGHNPEELRNNVSMFMSSLKKDLANLPNKSIGEVVLSSTRAPGFSLDGTFLSTNSPPI